MIDKKLLALLGDNKKYIFYVVALQVINLLANIGFTANLVYMIYLLFTDVKSSLIINILLALILIIIKFIITKSVGEMKDSLGRNVKKDLRSKVYQKIVKLGVRTTDEMSMAGLTQIAMEGIEQLDLYYSTYIPQFFYSMIAPLVLFLVTVWLDFRVALVLLLLVPLIPISIIAVSKYAKKIFAKYWGKYTSMGDDFLDSIQGLKELKIFRADKAQHEKINESAEEFRKVTMKVLVMQLASTTIMDLVAYGGAGLGIAMAILGFLKYDVNIFTSLFLILVAVEFFLPLRAFGAAFHIAMNGASAGNKIIELLNTKDPTWGEDSPSELALSLDHVDFSYEKDRQILKNVTMKFLSHGVTAIVGESGSGKSTVVSLLLGSYKPDKGDILIGKKKIEECSRKSYYKRLASVSYNTYIFNESIRDNFRLAKNNVEDFEIYEALKKVNLYDFVISNGGLDKVITEDALNISGGQKQRLALAINLVTNKDIYIFDEATSNIDIESEAIIMNNIKALAKTKAVIVISHRLENVVTSDLIYYMEKGEVKEQGTHEELMKLNGGYKKLYETQKKLEKGYMVASDEK